MIDSIVSVLVLTYNHESYIAQTLDSILEQSTDFKFDIVIGDDCSTDNTLDIIESYRIKNENKITILKSDENIGMMKNFVRTLTKCSGNYIATCDGDDFWCDTSKLQIQVDFMRNNPDYSIIFTKKMNMDSLGGMAETNLAEVHSFNFEGLIMGNFIPSVTALFKNQFFNKKMPEWILNEPCGDWPIYLMLLRDGSKVKFVNKVTGVYRTFSGISPKLKQQLSKYLTINLNILRNIKKDPMFKDKYEVIDEAISVQNMRIISVLIRESGWLRFLSFYLTILFRMDFIKLHKGIAYALYKKIT